MLVLPARQADCKRLERGSVERIAYALIGGFKRCTEQIGP